MSRHLVRSVNVSYFLYYEVGKTWGLIGGIVVF